MRNYKIDLLRGGSILLVLIHHFNIPYKLQDTFLGIQIGGESLSTLIARNGNYGVTIFFVISGFLITQHSIQRSGSLAQIRLKDFYIRRIARILLCLVLLVAIVTVLGALGVPPFINQSPNGVEVPYAVTVLSAFSFWMNLLIIEYGWVNYALGVLWSLSVEEVFYLAFPVLCLVLGRGKGLLLFCSLSSPMRHIFVSYILEMTEGRTYTITFPALMELPLAVSLQFMRNILKLPFTLLK